MIKKLSYEQNDEINKIVGHTVTDMQKTCVMQWENSKIISSRLHTK